MWPSQHFFLGISDKCLNVLCLNFIVISGLVKKGITSFLCPENRLTAKQID